MKILNENFRTCVYMMEKVSTVLPLRNVQCVRVLDVPLYFMQALFIVVLQ